MGYCTIVEVEEFLGQALTSARPDSSQTKIRLINVNNERDLNRISDDLVEFYISTADTQIDGILSQMYMTPLKKCANGEWPLDADINEYNQTVEMSDSTNLVPGNEIVIRNEDTGEEEYHIVNTIVDQYSVTTVSPILTSFTGDNIRVTRIQFPPPISQISARYAASYIYDKYFSAQNSPNISDYGKEMRRVAMGQLNDILNGKAILKCQRRIGDRFGNPYLNSSYTHQTPVDGYNTNDREMSDPK